MKFGHLVRTSIMFALAGVSLNVFAADTDAEARRLFSSVQQAFYQLRSNRPGLLPPPATLIAGRVSLLSLDGSLARLHSLTEAFRLSVVPQ